MLCESLSLSFCCWQYALLQVFLPSWALPTLPTTKQTTPAKRKCDTKLTRRLPTRNATQHIYFREVATCQHNLSVQERNTKHTLAAPAQTLQTVGASPETRKRPREAATAKPHWQPRSFS